MIYIFNEFNGKPIRFNLTVVADDDSCREVDVYVRSDISNTDLKMPEFHPCLVCHEVRSIIEHFGFNADSDRFLYFCDGKIIPALSSEGFGGLFTVTT